MVKHVYVGCSSRSRTAGPVNGIYRRTVMGDVWTLLDLPGSPEVYHVVMHATEPGVVLAATSKGLFRSDDHGDRWTCLEPTKEGEVMFCVHFHPEDPDTILVGTGPIGVMRTTDGGKTWMRLKTPEVTDQFPGAMFVRIMKLGIDHANPNLVWAGMEVNGMMRSEDGGETWSDLNDNLIPLSKEEKYQSKILTDGLHEGLMDVHSISVSPAAPEAVFVACRMGIFRGDDGGKTWTDLGIGRYSDDKIRYGREVIPAPWNPETLFACVGNHSRGEIGRLYRSDDLGGNWTHLDMGVPVITPMLGIAFEADDPDALHAVGRKQSFTSTDGGKSWREVKLPSDAGSAVTIAVG